MSSSVAGDRYRGAPAAAARTAGDVARTAGSPGVMCFERLRMFECGGHITRMGGRIRNAVLEGGRRW